MGTASGQSAVDRQFAVSVLMGTASGQSTVARINLFALSVLMGTASGQSDTEWINLLYPCCATDAGLIPVQLRVTSGSLSLLYPS